MPLQRRVPKFGFKNINRVSYQAINLDRLQEIAESKGLSEAISVDDLIANKVVGKNDLVKILGNGELKTKLTVSAHKFSASAKEAIEKAGGEAITL